VLDAVVLGDDPLVVMLVIATGEGAGILRLTFRRRSGARNEGQHAFPEMLFDEVFVKFERSSTNQSDVITHQTLDSELSLWMRRLVGRKSRVRFSVLPLSACVKIFLLDWNWLVFDGVRILIRVRSAEAESRVVVHHLVEDQPVTQQGHLVGTEVRTARTSERDGRRKVRTRDQLVEVLLGRVDKQSVGVETLITNRTHLTQIYESFFLRHLQDSFNTSGE